MPPLGLLTVAAMLPRDWNLKLVDANVSRLRDEDLQWADYVLLGAMIVQKDSVHEIAARCAALGKTVIAGGPLVTTGHEAFPQIQHFVLGEAEEIMPQVVEDMRQARVQPLYQAPHRPDVTHTPIPRWDLIDFQNYVTLSAQFSRGCPFDCEFCDIIVMNGRLPRLKTPEQFIAELDVLRLRGWEDMVFIVDDNFIGNKPRTKALLHSLIEWRARTRTKIRFLAEASMNLADDPELYELMVQAGFKKVFVGLKPRPSKRWPSATRSKIATVTWLPPCKPCKVRAWKSWEALSWASTATRKTSSSGNLNSSNAPESQPPWWDC